MWDGAKSLYNWGPPPPPSFLAPDDLAELMAGAHALSAPMGARHDVAIVGYGPVGQTARHPARPARLARRRASRSSRRPTRCRAPSTSTTRSAASCRPRGVADGSPGRTEPADVYEWRNAAGETLLRFDSEAAGLSRLAGRQHVRAARARAPARRAGARAADGRGARGRARSSGSAPTTTACALAVATPTAAARTCGARYVVGCDGANSFVRAQLGATVTDLGFFFDWLIVDVLPARADACGARSTSRSAIRAGRRRWSRAGPGRRRWEFMRLPGESIDELNSDETAWRLLAPWDVTPENARLERHTVYRFQARWVDGWRQGRLLLAGDAAHQMPPFAGQGMCSGLRDAANLAWKLDLVLAGRAPEALLDTYPSERIPHVRATIELLDGARQGDLHRRSRRGRRARRGDDRGGPRAVTSAHAAAAAGDRPGRAAAPATRTPASSSSQGVVRRGGASRPASTTSSAAAGRCSAAAGDPRAHLDAEAAAFFASLGGVARARRPGRGRSTDVDGDVRPLVRASTASASCCSVRTSTSSGRPRTSPGHRPSSTPCAARSRRASGSPVLRRREDVRQHAAVARLPSGTVTFVLSDIEGSTRRWQEDEAAMGQALARHDAIIRSAMEAHAGHVVKHTGDGLMAVFAGAADAIAAAVDAQRALQQADWGAVALVVRMGIHSGEAEERDGDYFGSTVNRVARLLAAAHGRQILVSSAAAMLAAERLDRGITLVDVGEHRLRDLDRAERVLQACADGLARDFPPLRTSTSRLRGFPATRTRIIGRERLLAEIAARLERASLVTLTGVGGSGKTRLAIEAARRAGVRLADGATFVDLSPLGEADLIAQTVASAVGVPDTSAGASGLDALLAFLAERRMLVVLDNCEHLIDGSAEIVDRLLATCPHVKVLATSREGLAVEGESMLAVPSLELPTDGRAAADSEAVQLFVERAAAARTDLDLLGGHEAAVVDICRRLDGIPLALELAAAQLAYFTPEEVDARLDDRFRLLAGGRRRIQRQATLQAAVDWSYDLLGPAERTLLARLSTFAGGFTLDAAEGVCVGGSIAAGGIALLLGSLVAKSLVVVSAQERTTRYRLLETIRLYAAERLAESGEADAVRGCHRDWYRAWSEALDREQGWNPALRWASDLPLLEREIDNLRSALAWSQQEGRPDLVARLATAAAMVWAASCNQDEGLRWIAAARTLPLQDPVLEAHCATIDGYVTMQQGRFLELPDKARIALESAEHAGLVASGHPHAVGPLVLAGFVKVYSDRETGRKLIRQGSAIAEARGLTDLAAGVLGYEGMLWLAEGRYDEAIAVLEPIARAAESGKPRFFDVYWGSELVLAYHLAGHHDEAVRVGSSVVLSLAARVHEPVVSILVPVTLALARAGGGVPDAEMPELLGLFDQARRDHLPVVAHYALTVMAVVLALRGDDEAASTVLATARAEGGSELPWRTPGHYALFHHYGRLLHARLGDDVARRCRAAGAGLSLDAAAALAREVVAGPPAPPR